MTKQEFLKLNVGDILKDQLLFAEWEIIKKEQEKYKIKNLITEGVLDIDAEHYSHIFNIIKEIKPMEVNIVETYILKGGLICFKSSGEPICKHGELLFEKIIHSDFGKEIFLMKKYTNEIYLYDVINDKFIDLNQKFYSYDNKFKFKFKDIIVLIHNITGTYGDFRNGYCLFIKKSEHQISSVQCCNYPFHKIELLQYNEEDKRATFVGLSRKEIGAFAKKEEIYEIFQVDLNTLNIIPETKIKIEAGEDNKNTIFNFQKENLEFVILNNKFLVFKEIEEKIFLFKLDSSVLNDLNGAYKIISFERKENLFEFVFLETFSQVQIKIIIEKTEDRGNVITVNRL